MKVAVLNEVSACSKNPDIMEALKGFDLEVYNLGMKDPQQQPQLNYIHTGLMAAVLLNSGAVDFVIGGCGTGQGFFNSVMQYPNIFCGLIAEPSDAFLFSQINDGNCISLPLLKGYGWAGELNLRYIFEKLFSGEKGKGYPQSRSESQRNSRCLLKKISAVSHLSMEKIIFGIPEEIIKTVVLNKDFIEFFKYNAADSQVKLYLF
jgi:ribose 5-phosphate isomerase RpiB